MGRIGITQEDVYNAAQAIAENGAFPTIQAVHAKLGRGSLGTIHKHLQAWKSERLLAPAINIEPSKNAVKAKEVLVEKLELEKTVKLQMEQNAALSAQLLEQELQNVQLQERINALEQEAQSLRAANSVLNEKVINHDLLLTELRNFYVATIDTIIRDKNSAIDNLQSELEKVHLASLEMVRKTSFEGQDALLSEKVKNINLADKVKDLAQQIARLEQELVRGSGIKGSNYTNPTTKPIRTYTLDEIYSKTAITNETSTNGES